MAMLPTCFAAPESQSAAGGLHSPVEGGEVIFLAPWLVVPETLAACSLVQLMPGLSIFDR